MGCKSKGHTLSDPRSRLFGAGLALVFGLLTGCGDDGSGGSDTDATASSSTTAASDPSASTSGDSQGTGGSTAMASTSQGPSTTDATTDTTTGGTDSDSETESDTEDETGGDDAWYPGIPYPTDELPGGIMPTLPTPGGQPGWPYDPIQLELPEPSGAADEYVVSTAGDDGSAGNGGNGTVEAPRRTIPVGTFDAGSKIFIVGQDSEYGTVDFDVGEDSAWQCAGAEDNQCFFVGIDGPRISRRLTVENSSHVIVDGLSFVDDGSGPRQWGSMNVVDSTYVTVRNVELRGNGENGSGGSSMSMSNVEFLFAYRMAIHDIGSWETNASGLDVHGWRPAYGNRYLWLIDSELYHLQADGVQTGNSSNDGPQENTSHYIYIAGNEFYENYENALDNKNSYHVVFSSNDVHDFYAAEGMGANGTAIILSNNSEGPWTGYHWAINNRIWNTSLALRDSGSEADERNFMVGNTIWNAEGAFVQANNAPNRECWIVHNTAHGQTMAFDMFQPGSNSSVFIHGNIFEGGELDTLPDAHSELRDNILFNVEQNGDWDVESGNIGEDPQLSDPASGDLSVAASSPAADAIARDDEVFTIFDTLYGLDIRQDQRGTARPSGGGWEIGAIELE